MRSIIIYYSLNGQVKRIAEGISRIDHADLYELRPQKPPKSSGFLRLPGMAMAVLFESCPALEQPLPNLASYDRVYIGGPVWFKGLPPYLRTYLNAVNLNEKIVIPFCAYDDSTGRFFDSLRQCCPLVRFYFGMGFKRVSAMSQDQLDEQIRVWLNNING